jgi:hypothetical protein
VKFFSYLAIKTQAKLDQVFYSKSWQKPNCTSTKNMAMDYYFFQASI